MPVTFPEILNDLTDARERYEADGVQYVVRFESESVQAGSAAVLLVYAQNVLDTPVQFAATVATQRTGMLGTGLLRGGSLKLETSRDMYIILAPGESGTWHLPLGVPANTVARLWDVAVSFKGELEGGSRPQRVRPSKASYAPGYLATLFDDRVGLGIAPVTGSNYESRDVRKATLRLNVLPAADPQAAMPDLTPDWAPAWVQSDMSLLSAAQREINNRRLHVVEELGTPALFEALSSSAQAHLDGTGLMPFPGETLAMAKILTYTVGLMMHDEESQNGMLVPVYMEAMRTGRPFNRTIEAVSWSGLQHLTRLAASISFGRVAQAIGRQPWTVAERRGVAGYVAQCIDQRMALPPEFLYLPLLLGALTVMPIRMHDDEVPLESLRSLGSAWHNRYEEVFKHDPELQEMVEVFNTIASATVSQMLPAKAAPAS